MKLKHNCYIYNANENGEPFCKLAKGTEIEVRCLTKNFVAISWKRADKTCNGIISYGQFVNGVEE